MTDQLQITGVAPPGPEAATTPGRGSPAASDGRPSGRPVIPEKPSQTAKLRGRCVECAQWPLVDEETGRFERHKYPKRDFRGRRGWCAAVGGYPERVKWAEPFR